MNINRNNYEEYFILYLDNELAANERRMVEEFMQNHPDLEEEMSMLQQAKLTPEDVLFSSKHLLMKSGENEIINLSNYEEYLVLYIDNELSPEERTAVERFVYRHPQIQKEMAAMQLTRIQPEEEVTFGDRSMLYRKEKKEKVFHIGWLRMAAAAVIILAIGISTYVIINRNSDNVVDPSIVDTKKTTPVENKLEQDNTPVNPIASPDTKNNSTQLAEINPVKNSVKEPQHKDMAKENKRSNNLPVPQNNNDVVTVSDPEDVTLRDPSKEKVYFASNDDGRNNLKLSLNENPVTIEDDSTPQIEENKNKKIRGFFRKATRIFERTTNIAAANDDNKVLVGAFAINLK